MQVSKSLTTEIQKHARVLKGFNLAHYLGTTHRIYNVSMPEMRKIAASFKKEHKIITYPEYLTILDALFTAPSFEERVMGSLILGSFPTLLSHIQKAKLDTWLSKLTGWAEVDIYSDEVDKWLTSNPKQGVALLKRWNNNPYLEKRRASLVVLCRILRHDRDTKWKTLGFDFIDNLTHEKHVMITKAISWILRAMIKYHKDDVRRYLNKNLSTLPNIAIREVTRKLETGRK